ncbi:MAG: hypothetical protein M4579_003654 [Chaenotheca gracillima]|nr:MAG: hypothetical protein M4579_003654 [Chaenotheca gracillima]
MSEPLDLLGTLPGEKPLLSSVEITIPVNTDQTQVPSDISPERILNLTVSGPVDETSSGTSPGIADPSANEAAVEQDTDSDDDFGEPIFTSTDKRQLQRAKFEAWVSEESAKVQKEELQAANQEIDDDEAQSARYLISRQESNVIINDAREYQLELFERAKQQNIIAVLDTGSGKTLIAVLLLRYVLDQELESRGLGKPRKISFFLVDCVTLVFQQHAVLECNLDQKIERFCGDMGCDFWSKGTWEKHFSENMVIVCTAQVLYDCLMHSFISIDQINLLIFDEAHHAKKEHAYARIIKDFYIPDADKSERPKIFGMTASPADAKGDVAEAAKQLERMLHSQIATTSNLSLLQKSIHRPTEQIAQYETLSMPFETDLYRRLHHAYSTVTVLARPFRIAKEASAELGRWCADQIWSFALAEEEASKLENKAQRVFAARGARGQSLEALDANLAQLREAQKVVNKHRFEEPQPDGNDLSSKVRLLRDYLASRFENPTQDKCIVFVEKRYAARVLAELFKYIGTRHLRVGVLTGARAGDAVDLNVTFHRQTITLTQFRKGTLNCLSQDPDIIAKANYLLEYRNGQYVCEVILPEASPIRTATGRPAQQKSMAKRSAAFEACLLLWQGKYLDDNLLPIFKKRLPAMRNAQLALNMKNTNAYEMRIKPEVWAETIGTRPDQVYVTLVELKESTGQHDLSSYQPLAIITRTKFPKLPSFPLHLSAGTRSDVVTLPLDGILSLTEEELDLINCFTLRIFKDVFNKTYEDDVLQMPYWIAPATNTEKIQANGAEKGLIEWDVLKFVKEHDELLWNDTTPPEFFSNRFVVDPGDGGRRFFTIAVAPQFKPLDPVPVDAPTTKHMDNILEYSSSLWRATRAKVSFRSDQPVIEAHRIMHRRNWLEEITEAEREVKTRCYICPQPLRLSALPARVASMSLIFPAIIFRLESYLIALDACKMLRLDIRADLALEAFTKDSDNTEEHQKEQIQFQRGMGKNYERLEFLGDCFLKMATSISLYTQCPDNDEYEYHVRRMLLVCNKNLFNTALELNLYEYIRSQSFSRRLWYPQEPKLLRGKGVKKGKEAYKHQLGDKTIADVSEAVIGAALLSHMDLENTHVDNAVQAVTRLVKSPDHNISKWADYYKLYKMPTYQTSPASQSQLDLVKQLFTRHDYHFHYPRLLRSAFQHPSYPFSWERIPSYQRLEFLGDALLDMACVNFLFRRFPDRDPQWLTEHKMAMVSNRFLGAVCVKLNFHKHLRHNGSGKLEAQIRDYVTDIQDAAREADGAPDYWVHVKSPPKALPDIVEAYVGAIFVDSEFNYQEVERFFEAHIRCFFEDMSIYDTFANNHPTTFLTNLLTLSFNCASFRLLAREIPPLPGPVLSSAASGKSQVIAAVMLHDEIVAEGRASSSKNAKVKASTNALEMLRGLAPWEYRKMYRCDCKAVDEEEKQRERGIAERVDAAGAGKIKIAEVVDFGTPI